MAWAQLVCCLEDSHLWNVICARGKLYNSIWSLGTKDAEQLECHEWVQIEVLHSLKSLEVLRVSLHNISV